MSQHAATIESLPLAFAVLKEMQADGLGWREGYGPLGREAPADTVTTARPGRRGARLS